MVAGGSCGSATCRRSSVLAAVLAANSRARRHGRGRPVGTASAEQVSCCWTRRSRSRTLTTRALVDGPGVISSSTSRSRTRRRPLIRDSASAWAGQTVAIVGPTGRQDDAQNLVMRFYELSGRRILLDGQESRGCGATTSAAAAWCCRARGCSRGPSGTPLRQRERHGRGHRRAARATCVGAPPCPRATTRSSTRRRRTSRRASGSSSPSRAPSSRVNGAHPGRGDELRRHEDRLLLQHAMAALRKGRTSFRSPPARPSATPTSSS